MARQNYDGLGVGDVLESFDGDPEEYNFKLQAERYADMKASLAGSTARFTRIVAQKYVANGNYSVGGFTTLTSFTVTATNPDGKEVLIWTKCEGMTAGGGANKVRFNGKETNINEYLRLDASVRRTALNNGVSLYYEPKKDKAGASIFEYYQGGAIEVGHIVHAESVKLNGWNREQRWEVKGFSDSRVKIKRVNNSDVRSVSPTKLVRLPDRSFVMITRQEQTADDFSLKLADGTDFPISCIVEFEFDSHKVEYYRDTQIIDIWQHRETSQWHVVTSYPRQFVSDSGFENLDDAIMYLRLVAEPK